MSQKYLLHTTFISQDGSYYPAKATPYDEADLPSTLLDKPKFWTKVEDQYVTPKGNSAFQPNLVTEVKKHSTSATDTVTVKKVDMYFKPNAETLANINSESLISSTDVVDLFNNPDDTKGTNINIHTATEEQLDSLPYVSLKTARKIIDLRESGVLIEKPEDLLVVNKGIDWINLPLEYSQPIVVEEVS